MPLNIQEYAHQADYVKIALYGESGIVDSSVLPLGKAIVSGSGDDLLVIGYSRAASAARV